MESTLANPAATGSVGFCKGTSYWKTTPSTTSSSFSIYCVSHTTIEVADRGVGVGKRGGGRGGGGGRTGRIRCAMIKE